MQTCCFTGHRKIPEQDLPLLTALLDMRIAVLAMQGIDIFLCGGALGFDMLAGNAVLRMKRQEPERYARIRLIMVLPCKGQEARWRKADQAAYHALLAAADENHYVSEAYTDGCMRLRNQYLAEHADICLAFCTHPSTGTAQTMRLAREHGASVENLAKGWADITHNHP